MAQPNEARDTHPSQLVSASRRSLLGLGLKSACLFLPLPYAEVWAQTAQGPQLQRLPKRALVIGNAAYAGSPLLNPLNDARAMGATLKEFGFEVTTLQDATKASMRAAIQAYLAALDRQKCVGVFYYAGHAVQIAWKNFLIPVDAQISAPEDIQRHCFDFTELMSGLTRASNAMNVIIMDACRDNPFGDRIRLEQKGLSQVDAPHSTILAYATAPGNTASDGTGSNGLYTENLLREIRVRDAKVEDVFKRVRLNVRRVSKGTQIPWESTSLEDDYSFAPSSVDKAAPADKEKDAAFAQELALWMKISESDSAAAFEDYLRRYPSGRHAELAQLRLNILLAREGEKPVQIAPSTGNPYTSGSAVADTAFRIGDQYTYRIFDLDTGALRLTKAMVVTDITDKEVVINNGERTLDLLGNPLKFADGRRLTGAQLQPLEYVVGKRWTTRFMVEINGTQSESTYDLKIVGKEKITVPAGTFDCYRVEGTGRAYARNRMGSSGSQIDMRMTYWMAPNVCRRLIRMETVREIRAMIGSQKLENDRYELESFRQA